MPNKYNPGDTAYIVLEAIKNVMDGLKYTAQQAMDLLKIPVTDQSKYAAKL